MGYHKRTYQSTLNGPSKKKAQQKMTRRARFLRVIILKNKPTQAAIQKSNTNAMGIKRSETIKAAIDNETAIWDWYLAKNSGEVVIDNVGGSGCVCKPEAPGI